MVDCQRFTIPFGDVPMETLYIDGEYVASTTGDVIAIEDPANE